jgi:hypothetical protein
MSKSGKNFFLVHLAVLSLSGYSNLGRLPRRRISYFFYKFFEKLKVFFSPFLNDNLFSLDALSSIWH